MSKKLKKLLTRIIVSAILLLMLILVDKLLLVSFEFPFWARLIAYIVPYLVIGYDIIRNAFRQIFRGGFLDENFLMTVATVGSFILGDYPEASFVMLFFQLGEWFQKYAVGKSRKSIAELMDIAPDSANLIKEGEIVSVSPDEIQIDDLVLVYPGERVPIDGVILEGNSSLNTAALTGESVPLDVIAGSLIYSGSINVSSPIKVKATKQYNDSTVKKILDLIENSSDNKSKSENFITKFARIYTPCVCMGAILLAIVGSLITGEWSVWINRALIFLVVSCPCALVISIPLSFFGGIGAASKNGVLIKGSSYLETLHNTKTFCFDKTGTLTKGNFAVTDIIVMDGYTKDEVLSTACICERYSTHPIACSIRDAYVSYGNSLPQPDVALIVEDPGKGIVYNQTVLCGNRSLMDDNSIYVPEIISAPGTQIFVANDKSLMGVILLQDEIKEGSKKALQGLKRCGIEKTIMLTGDNETIAEYVANQLGVDEYYASLFPQDKVALFFKIKLMSITAFVGDGINDAPVLKTADVGIAMGALGSDAAIEAADIVLMDDDPYKIVYAKKIAQKTMRIVKENIVFALLIKILTLVLSAFGITGMALAIFADVGVAVIAILNAMRALFLKENKKDR